MNARSLAVLMLAVATTSCSFFVSDSSTAVAGAKRIILERLRAPAKAVFREVTILDRSGKKYVLKVVFDAQNTFGALIRGEYIVALTVTSGGKFTYDAEYGAIDIQEVGEDAAIATAKGMNGWNTVSQ